MNPFPRVIETFFIFSVSKGDDQIPDLKMVVDFATVSFTKDRIYLGVMLYSNFFDVLDLNFYNNITVQRCLRANF